MRLPSPPDYFILPFKNLFDGIWLLDEYKDLKILLPADELHLVRLCRALARHLAAARGGCAGDHLPELHRIAQHGVFAGKLTEGGLTNLSGDYSLSVESSLLDFELDQYGQPAFVLAILGDIFFGDKLINFGEDTRYQQRNQFNSKPNIPNIFNIKKYLDLSFELRRRLRLAEHADAGDLGKSAGFNNSINFSMNLRLKQLFDPLFEDAARHGRTGAAGTQPRPAWRSGPKRAVSVHADSTRRADSTGKGSLGPGPKSCSS